MKPRLPEPGPGRPHHPGHFRRVPSQRRLEQHRQARERIAREAAKGGQRITRERVSQALRRALRASGLPGFRK